MRTLLAAATLALLLCACASAERVAVTEPRNAEPAQGRILVMLRMPHTHFRPDADYGADYTAGAGHEALKRIAARLAIDYGLDVVEDWPMPVLGVDCFVMRTRVPEGGGQIVERLEHDTRVESAQTMHEFRTLAQSASLYALQPAARAWRLDELHRIATGRGVRVAAVDTGVDASHPDLAGRIGLERNFVDGSQARAEAHGTAVAGIIAAHADLRSGTVGIAPEAFLLALRACWEVDAATARCSSFTLAKALQFAIDQRSHVINLSLSGPPDRLLGRLLDAAMAGGATVVAAVDRRAPDGGFPASHPHVLAVDMDANAQASEIVLLAPGVDIPVALPGGRWALVTGASFAAAEVSGVVALLRQLAPALPPDKVRHTLAADPASGDRRTKTIDAYAAIERTADACDCAVHTATPKVP
jgi:subtilisin family serine protease